MTKSRFVRLAGLCAALAPLLSFGLMFYAITLSPWFSWQGHALSDLGVPGRSSAPLFNASLILGAALNIPLLLALRQWLGPRQPGPAGVAVALLGTVAMGLVGVFPASVMVPHALSAMTYFLLLPAGYILIGVALWRQGRRAHGLASIVTALAAYGVMLLAPHGGMAVIELLSALLLATRSFAVGLELWLEGGSAPSGGGDLLP